MNTASVAFEPSEEFQITLEQWDRGSPIALEELIPLVRKDLRAMARAQLSRNRGHLTLQPTALVNELFVRLLQFNAMEQVESSAHFFHLASRVMRQILVQRARTSLADKRGGNWIRDEYTESLAMPANDPPQLVELHEALEELAKLHPRMAQVVELRYFGGYEVSEVAVLLDVEERTVYRDWATARAWLRVALEAG